MTNRWKYLVLATANEGKIREFRGLLRGLPLELKSLRDFDDIPDVEETGQTYSQNAELKAQAFARRTEQLALADDSGLEIEALGNAPGVLSARFAGADAGYDAKIQKLLAMLAETGDTGRRARFVSSAVLANPSGEILYKAEGVCPGAIAESPRGT